MRIPVSVALAVFLAATGVVVTSAYQACEYRVTPTWIELDGSQHSGVVNVETQPGCAWTVDTFAEGLHVGTPGGSGSGVVSYQVDALPTGTPLRQGTVRVRWAGPTAGQNVFVTQNAGPCAADFSPGGPTSPQTLGWKGGSGFFDVFAEPAFSGQWRVISAPVWTTFSPALGVTGRGDSATLFVAAPNPSSSPRDGTVTFCSGQTFTLHQAGRTGYTGSYVPADFDGDGIADPAIYRPSTGTWYALPSSGAYSYSLVVPWGNSAMVPLPGDFDGDNRSELAVYDPNPAPLLFGWASQAGWSLRYSSNSYGTTVTSFGFEAYNSTPQALPLMADFNGDGRSDFVSWRPDTAEWAVGVTDRRIPTRLPEHFFVGGEHNGHWQWGLPGDVPVPADFDGDGLADLAVWRPSNGVWYIRRSSDDYNVATARIHQWGLPGDRPIVGDFDGDGRTDLIVWRPSDGAWYVAYASADYSPFVSRRIQWGLPGDIPVAGDYDGDGRLDPAVWRPSNGFWYVLLSTQAFNQSRIIQWGLPGDVPLSGRITRSQ